MNSEKRWSKRPRTLVFLLLIVLLLGSCGSRQAVTDVSGSPRQTEETSLTGPAEPGSGEEAQASRSAEPQSSAAAQSTTEAVPEEAGSKAAEPHGTAPAAPEGEERMIYAHVGGKTLRILPAENSSADAFLELLKRGDVTVEMHDYGNFEKVGPLGTSLPRNDEQITTEPGDVILYQGNQITIYYGVNSWSFTRLGKVQDLPQAQLKEILGSGNVTVTFSLRDAGASAGL